MRQATMVATESSGTPTKRDDERAMVSSPFFQPSLDIQESFFQEILKDFSEHWCLLQAINPPQSTQGI
jgi:hypothetical protein